MGEKSGLRTVSFKREVFCSSSRSILPCQNFSKANLSSLLVPIRGNPRLWAVIFIMIIIVGFLNISMIAVGFLSLLLGVQRVRRRVFQQGPGCASESASESGR